MLGGQDEYESHNADATSRSRGMALMPPEWMTRSSKRLYSNNFSAEEEELLHPDNSAAYSDEEQDQEEGGEDEDEEEDEDEPLDEETLAWVMEDPPSTMWGRVKYEANELKEAPLLSLTWTTFFSVFVVFCASYYGTVGRFRFSGNRSRTTHTVEGISRSSVDMDAFARNVRTLPEAYEIATLKHDLTHLRSTIGLSEDFPGEWNNVTLGMHAMTHYVHGHSHMRLPAVWNDCLHVGIAGHDIFKGPNATSAQERESALRQLRIELQTAEQPTPSDVLPWFGGHNRTGFLVEGYVARYCLSDLEKQGMVTKPSNPNVASAFNMPYARAIRATDRIGRAVGQLVTLHWYQHQWGKGTIEDPLYHTSILQDINPIRSGVQALRYTGVANRTNAPVPPIDPGIQRIDMSHLAE